MAHHGDGVIGAEQGINAQGGGEKDVLDVIHLVNVGHRIGNPGQIKIVPGGDVVAEVNQVGALEVGDDEVQIVDELDAGDRVARRVGPDEGGAQGLGLRVRGEGNFIGATLTSGQRVGWALIDHDHRIGGSADVGRVHPAVEPPLAESTRLGSRAAIATPTWALAAWSPEFPMHRYSWKLVRVVPSAK